jgi:hypothetical protein
MLHFFRGCTYLYLLALHFAKISKIFQTTKLKSLKFQLFPYFETKIAYFATPFTHFQHPSRKNDAKKNPPSAILMDVSADSLTLHRQTQPARRSLLLLLQVILQ